MNHSRLGPWQRERHAWVRAFSGAFLFGAPLLYTMEMWQIGLYIERWKLFAFLALALLANLGLNYFAGFRSEWPSLIGAVNQSVDAVMVGIVAATAVLLVLNRVNFDEPFDSIIGQISLQVVPLSLGASIANAVLGQHQQGGQQQDQDPGNLQKRHHGNSWQATLNDLGATVAGGIFVGFSVAPTEEIPMLAGELGYVHKLALIGLSLVVTYGIVFASGFDPEQAGPRAEGIFQHPITETAMSYIVSLLVALVALVLFDHIERHDPITDMVAQMVVLGFVTSIGGAAGRVVI